MFAGNEGLDAMGYEFRKAVFGMRMYLRARQLPTHYPCFLQVIMELEPTHMHRGNV